jgi:phosphatidylserine decarboxylase
MGLARDGWKEMLVGSLVLAAAAWGLAAVHPALAIVPLLIWVWLIAFFRDPHREGRFAPGEMCSAADGRVTEISRLPYYEGIDGPAIRIGVFLSIFNVHVNRSPCAATVRSVTRSEGLFLDARHPESGARNQSATLLLDPTEPSVGPVIVRQVVGKIARRIVCHARPGDRLERGQRFGMIKFGSRTELIVPDRPEIEVAVKVGDAVRGGLTVMVRQRVPTKGVSDEGSARGRLGSTASA